MEENILQLSQLSMMYLLIIFVIICGVLLSILSASLIRYNRLDRKLKKILEETTMIVEIKTIVTNIDAVTTESHTHCFLSRKEITQIDEKMIEIKSNVDDLIRSVE